MDHKYINMSLEDLVDDNAFIAWVNQEQSASDWNSWLIAQDDKVHEKFRIARTMILSLSDAKSVDHMNTQAVEKLWNRINTTIATKSKVGKEAESIIEKGHPRIIKMLTSIAAAVALFFIITNRSGDTVQIHRSSDVMMAINLPAASSIKLHPNSDVQYDEKNWEQMRTVKLDGSAEFDVTKGVPFRVETDLGSVEVLGTSFLVKEESETFVVNVSSGRVAVKYGPDNHILTKGMAYLSNPSQADRKVHSGETSTFLRYDNVEIQEVLNGLSEYYGVSFKGMNEERNRELTTVYDTTDLDSALRKVFFPLKWKYEIRGKTVIIS